ncbi:2'-5' RNA ligase family protein [Nocardioides caldifontis]|uniref:2'-5' RNA ligase family protein n=1 Tax=Nocardioides caldifontis TaxID=2588938 RepID=UPI0011DF818B|nr:2'-5' RNA ligase family protein [Nocardioides caldifontis]
MTTIGVSVAVPEPWGSDLQEYRVKLGDPTAAGIPTHVTLLPPVDVDEALVPGIHEHLAAIASATAPFAMRLRGTGTFRPVSPVVFVNVVEGISSCEVLAAAVRRGPLAIDAQFPYHPHVTVAHHLEEPLLDRAYEELGSFDCRFTVDRFSLYVHEAELGWTPVKDFALTGNPGGAR